MSAMNGGGRLIVLVVGMPRSGTTWLGKMLDCHPTAFYLHEPDTGSLYSHLPIFIESSGNREQRDRVPAFFQSLPDKASIRSYTRLPLYKKNYHSPPTWIFIRTLALLEKLFSPLSRKVFPLDLLRVPRNAPFGGKNARIVRANSPIF